MSIWTRIAAFFGKKTILDAGTFVFVLNNISLDSACPEKLNVMVNFFPFEPKLMKEYLDNNINARLFGCSNEQESLHKLLEEGILIIDAKTSSAIDERKKIYYFENEASAVGLTFFDNEQKARIIFNLTDANTNEMVATGMIKIKKIIKYEQNCVIKVEMKSKEKKNIGELLFIYRFHKVQPPVPNFIPPEKFNSLLMRVVRATGLNGIVDKDKEILVNPSLVYNSGEKQVFRLKGEVNNSLYPIWGQESAVALSLSGLRFPIDITVYHYGSNKIFGTAVFSPSSEGGQVTLPLMNEFGENPDDEPLGSITVLWAFDTMEVPHEQKKHSRVLPEKPPYNLTPVKYRKSVVMKPEASPEELAAMRERLVVFYKHYSPDKLNTIDDIVERYTGREKELFETLTSKYGPEPKDLPKEEPEKAEEEPEKAEEPPNEEFQVYPVTVEGTSEYAGNSRKVPVLVNAIVKLRGIDLDLFEAAEASARVKFLQMVLRDIADGLMIDPRQLSVGNVGAGFVVEFAMQLTEEQNRKNIQDVLLMKVRGGMFPMIHANESYVRDLHGAQSLNDSAKKPLVEAESSVILSTFRVNDGEAPRVEMDALALDPNFDLTADKGDKNSPYSDTRGAQNVDEYAAAVNAAYLKNGTLNNSNEDYSRSDQVNTPKSMNFFGPNGGRNQEPRFQYGVSATSQFGGNEPINGSSSKYGYGMNSTSRNYNEMSSIEKQGGINASRIFLPTNGATYDLENLNLTNPDGSFNCRPGEPVLKVPCNYNNFDKEYDLIGIEQDFKRRNKSSPRDPLRFADWEL